MSSVYALTRAELLGIAVARGCRHYRNFARDEELAERPEISHEALGCALLRGETTVDTFQAIRAGAMIVSDSGCSPQQLVEQARALGVEHRLAHIARVAPSAGDRGSDWQSILAALPSSAPDEVGFLPTLSRFVSETGIVGPGRGGSRIWLRTSYFR